MEQGRSFDMNDSFDSQIAARRNMLSAYDAPKYRRIDYQKRANSGHEFANSAEDGFQTAKRTA